MTRMSNAEWCYRDWDRLQGEKITPDVIKEMKYEIRSKWADQPVSSFFGRPCLCLVCEARAINSFIFSLW
jgi:hypothetical protein